MMRFTSVSLSPLSADLNAEARENAEEDAEEGLCQFQELADNDCADECERA